MSDKHKIELYLSGPQKSKFLKKLPFQLTDGSASIPVMEVPSARVGTSITGIDALPFGGRLQNI